MVHSRIFNIDVDKKFEAYLISSIEKDFSNEHIALKELLSAYIDCKYKDYN